MTVDLSRRASRRSLLGASIGAAAATLAGWARPSPTVAADGAPVLVGGEYTGSSVTKLTTTDTVAFWGESGTNYGVFGVSNSLVGVYGSSQTGHGISGISGGPTVAALIGRSVGHSVGVQGHSGTDAVPPASPRTGVYGFANQDGSARGVVGESPLGQGIRGLTSTGIGVRGYASGTGVAASFQSASGYAIQASGRLSFGKASGVATVSAGTSSVVVTPGIDVAAGTFVLATLNGSAGGTTAVMRVATDPTNNRFTIVLTGNAAVSVKVAWLVMG